jgi:hypothetical protein
MFQKEFNKENDLYFITMKDLLAWKQDNVSKRSAMATS